MEAWERKQEKKDKNRMEKGNEQQKKRTETSVFTYPYVLCKFLVNVSLCHFHLVLIKQRTANFVLGCLCTVFAW